jgi:hypothetical protein
MSRPNLWLVFHEGATLSKRMLDGSGEMHVSRCRGEFARGFAMRQTMMACKSANFSDTELSG